MKPSLEQLRGLAPEAGEELAREHRERLEERYFELFAPAVLGEHLRALARLSPEHPVEVLVHGGREVDCTIVAFDYPGEFSILTGILGATGFNILTGDVFTWSQAGEAARPAGRRPAPQAVARSALLRRRRIIDHFTGRLASPEALEMWEQRLRRLLSETVLLLESERAQGLARARQRVDELAAVYLSSLALRAEAVLYPANIEVIRGEGGRTVLRVVSQDTPLFLYSLSSALALRSIFIDHIRIRTADNRIEDEFSFLDARGTPITEPAVLDQVKLSVLLTKQFTYFLGSAPDPYAALRRFESLVESVLAGEARWVEMLSNPRVLQELARVLGASDFLWEDFIRLQYETLLPLLEPHARNLSSPPGSLLRLLGEAVARAPSPAEKRRALNEFKDREIFLLELEYILDPQADFQKLSRGLTRLAEAVVGAAVRLSYEELAGRYGLPRTVAGLTAEYAVLGLGKLGGGELGYASDIELLFVYSDQGRTQGGSSAPVSNAEFFEELVRETTTWIRAKKEGIFQIDLRLRPYGTSGPKASSLESFCWYFGSKGEAHALERLALARLRAIAGSRSLGEQIERIRDELLYSGPSLEAEELEQARQRQLDARTRSGELNAKLSPGALRDLEWVILLLQSRYGREHPELRTPFLREVLDRLPALGVLSAEEAQRLSAAYEFLRRLINSLRMLRGSAADLYLPALDSQEYVHLARRMGYTASAELTPAQKLRLDFETLTAAVRYAVERHLGRASLPDGSAGNVADLILSEGIPASARERILRRSGFRRPERAYRNLRGLAAADPTGAFLRLSVLAVDYLKHRPDPDMALNNWERFLARLGPGAAGAHFRGLAAQPRRLDMLLAVFAGSQFLSDTLIQSPEFFEWATQSEHLHRERPRAEMLSAFRELAVRCGSHAEWLAGLRRYRRREFVRLGIRDICLGAPIREIMRELSVLAEAILQSALEQAAGEAGLPADSLSILAFGKLGGEELNYSSDIDLLALAPPATPPGRLAELGKVMEHLRADLAGHSEEGYVYRVDLRLRPYGRSGELVGTSEGVLRYYRESAAVWELQALLKARPVAGSLELGAGFLRQARKLLARPFPAAQVLRTVADLRRASRARLPRALPAGPDIKEGSGGIRDVEFLVQALQLAHAPAVLAGNTLEALEGLRQASILAPEQAESLARDYLFLRRIEHYLQIFEDRQTHTLPSDPAELEALARRALGPDVGAERFSAELAACLARVDAAFQSCLQN